MKQKPSFSRRKFVAFMAADPAATYPEARRDGRWHPTFSKLPYSSLAGDAQRRTQPFPMTQVRLLPSTFLDAAEWNRGYMSR
ncbi:MAG: hypothetical protein ABI806_16480 [Candidatus Solibacter sp.]